MRFVAGAKNEWIKRRGDFVRPHKPRAKTRLDHDKYSCKVVKKWCYCKGSARKPKDNEGPYLPQSYDLSVS